jgi:predicted molibdopterin-dependent oxidoreductase YjgC
VASANVVLPGATWAEKAGTFENWKSVLQAFEQAIPVVEMAKSEGQIALDLAATLKGAPVPQREVAAIVVETTRGQVAAGAQVALPRAEAFNAANVRAQMAKENGLAVFATGVSMPAMPAARTPDMEVMDL